MTTPAEVPRARSLGERRDAAINHLKSNNHLWLATAGDGGGAHLIPVSYVWDGRFLTAATFTGSRTVRNLRSHPAARCAIGTTSDVLMINAVAAVVDPSDVDPDIADAHARIAHDPRSVPGFSYLRLTLRRMQVWRGVHEFAGRTVMRDGEWLERPVN